MRADRSFCIRLLRVQAGLFLLGTFFSSSGLAFFPSLKELQPRGAQRGTAFKLTLVGSGLTEGLEVRTTLPASFTPLAAPQPGNQGQDSERAIFLVELDADAPIDLYPIRVITPSGMSNLLLFSVGKFREVQEKDEVGEASEALQPVEAPVTAIGRNDRGPNPGGPGVSVALDLQEHAGHRERTGPAQTPGQSYEGGPDPSTAPGLQLRSRSEDRGRERSPPRRPVSHISDGETILREGSRSFPWIPRRDHRQLRQRGPAMASRRAADQGSGS